MLGNNRPPLLLQVEMELFKSLFQIATQGADLVTEMGNFINRLPWGEISQINDNSASWFKRAARNDASTSGIQDAMEKMNVDVATPQVSQPNIPATPFFSAAQSQERASSTACVEQDARMNQGDSMLVDKDQTHGSPSSPRSPSPLPSEGREPSPSLPRRPSPRVSEGLEPSSDRSKSRSTSPVRFSQVSPSTNKRIKLVGPSEKSKGKRPRDPTPEPMDVDDEVNKAPGPRLRPRIKNSSVTFKEAPPTKVTPPTKKKAQRRHPTGELMKGASPSEPINVDKLFVSMIKPYTLSICL